MMEIDDEVEEHSGKFSPTRIKNRPSEKVIQATVVICAIIVIVGVSVGVPVSNRNNRTSNASTKDDSSTKVSRALSAFSLPLFRLSKGNSPDPFLFIFGSFHFLMDLGFLNYNVKHGKPNIIIMQPDDFPFFAEWSPPPRNPYPDSDKDRGPRARRKFAEGFPAGFTMPNLERLRKQGLQMTQAYTASAACATSRYSTITGRYPSRVRIIFIVYLCCYVQSSQSYSNHMQNIC